MTPAARLVFDVLSAAGAIGDDDRHEATCQVVANAVANGAAVERVTFLLDKGGIAVQHDPATEALAEVIVARLRGAS